MKPTPPVVLTIAGFDPSSGAGITADIKTIAANGCYGVACITALTVQSTTGVSEVQALAPEFISDTLRALSLDLDIAAIHIGMLGTAKVARAVGEFLEGLKAKRNPTPAVVLDPILKSSSGADLLDRAGVKVLITNLLPICDVLTPNLDEAAALTGSKVLNLDQMRAAATLLHDLGSRAVVITGGHLDRAIDLLSWTTTRGIEQEVFKTNKLNSANTHGTGCAFATSIACHLALNRGLAESVLLAKTYVTAAIAEAYPLGKGNGPLNHLYRNGQSRRARPKLPYDE